MCNVRGEIPNQQQRSYSQWKVSAQLTNHTTQVCIIQLDFPTYLNDSDKCMNNRHKPFAGCALLGKKVKYMANLGEYQV